MTTTTSPGTVPGLATDAATAPQCEAILQCVERCCDPQRCDRPAVARVSFRCTSSGCDHAGDLLLLCETCTRIADVLGDVLARRPL